MCSQASFNTLKESLTCMFPPFNHVSSSQSLKKMSHPNIIKLKEVIREVSVSHCSRMFSRMPEERDSDAHFCFTERFAAYGL